MAQRKVTGLNQLSNTGEDNFELRQMTLIGKRNKGVKRSVSFKSNLSTKKRNVKVTLPTIIKLID